MSGVIDLTSDDESIPSRAPINDNNPSDDEDEDLKLAIALSLQDQTNIEEAASKTAVDSSDSTCRKIPKSMESSSGVTGLLGLDRKAMEAERLARLKRKREPYTNVKPATQPPSTLSNSTSRLSPPPPRRQKPNPAPTLPSLLTTTTTTTTIKSSPTFPTPQILLTSQPSRLNPEKQKYISISLPDILTPPTPTHTLKSTLLSSFIADLDWLFTHFNTRNTTFLLLLHAQTPQHRALLESDFAGLKNVKLLMPEVMGTGNMHSKVMLLFYQEGAGAGNAAGAGMNEICRVVIPSANLTRADWGVGGVMENVLFVVDLPIKRSREEAVYPFETKLKAQLSAMGVPDNVLRKLEHFDFTATRDVEFVYSRSGSNALDLEKRIQGMTTPTMKGAGIEGFFQKRGKESRKKEKEKDKDEEISDGAERVEDVRSGMTTDDPASTGLLSLQDAVISLGLDVPVTDLDSLPLVDFITSSLGNLTSQFVRQLYLAICGQLDPAKMTVASNRPSANKTTPTKSADTDATLDRKIMENLKIYFPTSETVHRSKGGPSAGSTICFQSKWWDSNDLIRKCLHNCVGVRKDGILMHSKILYVRFRVPKQVLDRHGHEKLYAGWAYVGSANLSESAWGRVVNDAKSKQSKLTCRNWESGVLVPVEMNSPTNKTEADLGTKYEDGIGRHVGKQDSNGGRGLSKEVTSRHGSRFDACASPTSVKESAMQVKAGKDDTATEMQVGSSTNTCLLVDGDAFNEGIMQSTSGATKTPKDASRGREWLTGGLSEAFSEVVPVPIQHPAAGHIARQQKPWFFMERGI